jgi:hypothetical protein
MDAGAGLILVQTGCYAPGVSSTSKHKRASVFSAYGRKFKPPASRVVVDSVVITVEGPLKPEAVSFVFFQHLW